MQRNKNMQIVQFTTKLGKNAHTSK